MPPESAQHILDESLAIEPRCGSTRVIAIDGPSGSGKTTLAAEIASAATARGLRIEVIHTDSLCPGWDGLPEVPERLESLLHKLAAGTTVAYPIWDWELDSPGDDATLSPCEVLVLEGVGAGALRCAPYLCARVFLDGPESERKRRALARDGAMFTPHWDAWAAAERAYFATNWASADPLPTEPQQAP